MDPPFRLDRRYSLARARIGRAPGGRGAAPVASCAVPASAPDSGADDPEAGGRSSETPVGDGPGQRRRRTAGGVRAPGPSAQRRLEFRRRLHASRRSLRAVPPRRVRALRRHGVGRRARRGVRGAWAGCAGTAAIARARGTRPSSRTPWATWSRPSASCRPGWRRSRRAWPPRTVPSKGWPGSPRRAELGPWVEPVAAHVRADTPGGDVVHADCGEGDLLDALAGAGVPAHGVEPRGAVALDALERGWAVTIGEASEHLAGRPAGSVGGIVLSGVVDRLPLHALVSLLGQCTRTLARGAPLVVRVRVHGHGGKRRPTTWSPGRRSTRRRGSCSSSAPVWCGWNRWPPRAPTTAASPCRPPCPRERGPPLRPRPPPWRRRGAPHPAPARRRRARVGSSRTFTSTPSRRRRRTRPCPVLSYPEAARPGRRGRLPVRHRVGHGALAGRAPGGPGRELPQHHAAGADGAVGQPPGPRPAAGPGGPAPAGASRRARRGRLGVQRGPPGRGGVRPDGGDRAVGQPGRRGHRPGRPPGQSGPPRRCRGALARRGAGVAQQGPREHGGRTGRGPRPRRPRRHAARRGQAGHRLLCRRAAALRGRVGPERSGHVHRPRQRCHGGGRLRLGRRAGGDVGARGLLRAGGRGHVDRPARGGLRPGRRARGARCRRCPGGGQGPLRAGRRHRRAARRRATARGSWRRRAAGGWPSWTWRPRPTASSTCLLGLVAPEGPA